jgi:hypothetical protein
MEANKYGDLGVREEGDMAHYLVDNVGLRSVIGGVGVADVLCAAEHSKGKALEKLPLTQYPMGGLNGEPRLTFEVLAEFVQLRDSLGKVEGLLQLLHLHFKPSAHSPVVQSPQFLKYPLPKECFFMGVLNIGDRLIDVVLQCNLRNVVSAFSILFINKLWVIPIFCVLNIQQYFPDEVEVLKITREPWDLNSGFRNKIDTLIIKYIFQFLHFLFVLFLNRDIQMTLLI